MFILIIGLSPISGAQGAKIDSPAPDFALKDQYERELRLSQLRGRVVLLVYADREGSKFTGKWSKAVREKYSQEQVRIIGMANLGSVPFLFRRFAKESFQGTTPDGKPKDSVLLDWKGVVADRYGFRENLTNVYLIDSAGVLRHVAAGTGSASEVGSLFQVLDRVLKTATQPGESQK